MSGPGLREILSGLGPITNRLESDLSDEEKEDAEYYNKAAQPTTTVHCSGRSLILAEVRLRTKATSKRTSKDVRVKLSAEDFKLDPPHNPTGLITKQRVVAMVPVGRGSTKKRNLLVFHVFIPLQMMPQRLKATFNLT